MASEKKPYVFPRWANLLLPVVVVLVLIAPLDLGPLIGYGASPVTTDVGYQPEQPVPYSHALHVGELGLDCRYCHTTVEKAAFAAIPPTQTCLNCHNDKTQVRWDRPSMLPIKESQATGEPIEWVKVHDLPDYAYFNHSAHVNKGVGCNECHGRVDKMEVVYQAEPLSMAWCLECHRDPAPRLRPKEAVTQMDWVASEDRRVLGERLIKEYNIKSERQLTDCSTCHR